MSLRLPRPTPPAGIFSPLATLAGHAARPRVFTLGLSFAWRTPQHGWSPSGARPPRAAATEDGGRDRGHQRRLAAAGGPEPSEPPGWTAPAADGRTPTAPPDGIGRERTPPATRALGGDRPATASWSTAAHVGMSAARTSQDDTTAATVAGRDRSDAATGDRPTALGLERPAAVEPSLDTGLPLRIVPVRDGRGGDQGRLYPVHRSAPESWRADERHGAPPPAAVQGNRAGPAPREDPGNGAHPDTPERPGTVLFARLAAAGMTTAPPRDHARDGDVRTPVARGRHGPTSERSGLRPPPVFAAAEPDRAGAERWRSGFAARSLLPAGSPAAFPAAHPPPQPSPPRATRPEPIPAPRPESILAPSPEPIPAPADHRRPADRLPDPLDDRTVRELRERLADLGHDERFRRGRPR
ncbi:hypothetical protein [Actinoplanes awajinensis]|uniref:hypothetical protein n=1 Tax=Actinoplanes awajinensis TaxID=135946 RepID=UPI0012FB0C13|nr:hypothetical protein [Actinoplanes awajinensis]